ncbi:queuosine precursor transporter [Gleimia hominis]|uniref:queuosine precursor transporter n=1 Tax=Gleimia hominis TaxID=595468 RepID=UPI000C7FEF80|nr:queuosine precursor transporter [Gleimia hominis]WIK65251.1 queuosine precursor transporter [Gleimia hominis]
MEQFFDSRVRPTRLYDFIAVAFVALLLLSNIAATKLIAFDLGFWKPIFDGGAVLFPLTYILGDVLSEVYGFAKASRVIAWGFGFSILASLTFWLVGIAPPGPGYENQAAFVAVLGFVPRIVAASIAGYLAGQLLNAWVLVKIKQRWGSKHLWARLIGSTVVGEFADTLIFCTIAFYGIITGADFLNYLLVGYFYKVGVEVVCLPLTYPTIAVVKRVETRFAKRVDSSIAKAVDSSGAAGVAKHVAK